MSKPIYIQNKYLNWYNSIISKAVSESRSRGLIYYENHHILPKSLGGVNSKNNLVLLTGREHYICHYLLTKFTTSKNKSKMIYAFNCMNTLNLNYKNSKLYECNKHHFINQCKLFKHSEKTKYEMSKRMSGENNPMYGKKNTIEQKLKSSISLSGENNYRFCGYFITPWGKFNSAIKSSTNLITDMTITKWCKHSNTIITNHLYRCSKYLKSLNESPVGKTFKEIGFDFIPLS